MTALPYRVIHGDCLEVLRGWQDGCVTAIVGDAPYSDHTHGSMLGNRGRNLKGKAVVVRATGFPALTPDEITAHAAQFCRVATQWIELFSDDLTLPLWRAAIRAGKGIQGRTMPWCRWSSPFSGGWPPSGAEFIVVARPRKREKRRAWLNPGRTHYDTKCLRACSKEKQELAEWSEDPSHPGSRAQKPIALMEALLSDCCVRGDTVVDPYADSGTTGIAALRLGMRVVLIEKRRSAYEMCKARMDREWQRLSERG